MLEGSSPAKTVLKAATGKKILEFVLDVDG